MIIRRAEIQQRQTETAIKHCDGIVSMFPFYTEGVHEDRE
jgi:hypothetical protein